MDDAFAELFPQEACHVPSLMVCGVEIPADPDVITSAIRRAMIANRFESEEARQVRHIVEPGDRVVEIGAGIGFISTLLSREPCVSSVLAVEANPHLLAYMARLHRLNGVRNVRRINVVPTNSEVAGAATFYIRRDFWMGSLTPGPNPYVGAVDVPTRNFSAILREEAANLIVCDVEGAEAFLFEGADLSGVERVFVEVHDHITGLSGVGALFATLATQGFVYDPRHSEGSVILFRRLRTPDVLRPYRG